MKETYTRTEVLAIINNQIIKYHDDMFIPYSDTTSDNDAHKRFIAKKNVDALRRLRNEFLPDDYYD